MTNIRFLKDSWDKYQEMVIPKAATPKQIAASRTTFYAGAVATMTIINASLDTGDTETFVTVMDQIQGELSEFVEEVGDK